MTTSQTRALHERDIVTLVDQSLSALIERRLDGEVLLIAPEDDRLTPYIPVEGQRTLGETQLSLPADADLYVEPLPTTADDQLPQEPDAYDTTISLFSKLGYFQRMVPFQEATRVTRQGGRILQATGLQPTEPPDHDFKGWVSASEKATLTELLVTRHTDYATPKILADWQVTTSG